MTSSESPGARVARKIRVRAIVFLVLALAAGGGAVLLVKQYLDSVRGRVAAATTQTVPVVVAAMDVPIATQLAEQHLAVTTWPAKHVPQGSFTKLEEVVGRTVRQAVIKGEPLLDGRLADKDRGDGLAAVLDKGMRAMAVRVDQVVGVAGFVQPGDFVDVITTMPPDEETRKDLKSKAAKLSKIILQNIRVLTVGEHMATKGNKPVKVQVVTLAVSPDDSERLALASGHGTLQLTMRSRIDPDRVPTAGVTPVALLAPDEGMKDETPAPAVTVAERPRRTRPAPRQKKVDEPPKPAAPVVEILRGGKVEERKLRISADSKR